MNTAGLGLGQSKQNQQLSRSQLQVHLLQLALISAISLLLMLKDFTSAYSAFIGGLLYIIPAAWFSLRVLAKGQLRSPKQILANVYTSEVGKVLLAIALFSLTFAWVSPLNGFALFTTYILLQLSGWYLQLKMNNRFQKL